MSRMVRNKKKENRPSSSGGDRCTVKKVHSSLQKYGIRVVKTKSKETKEQIKNRRLFKKRLQAMISYSHTKHN